MNRAEAVSARQKHWDRTWCEKDSCETSWYQEHPARSLDMILEFLPMRSAALIDVGGGASRLVDCLLDEGYRDVTVLDVSEAALRQSQERLESRSNQVNWLVEDITRYRPARLFDLWHDRAVFHFLTAAQDRRDYVQVLKQTLAPDGLLVMATFAREGPPRCSGLDVVRYDAEHLATELGEDFRLEAESTEWHGTPAGGRQLFAWYGFRRVRR